MTFDPSEFSLARYVFGLNGARRADVLLRFETLDADFAALVERIGLPPTELPRLKVVAGLAAPSDTHPCTTCEFFDP